MAPIPITWNGKDAQGNPLRWNTPGLTWNGFLPTVALPKNPPSSPHPSAPNGEPETEAKAWQGIRPALGPPP